MSDDRKEHKQLLQRLPQSVRRKIVAGEHLNEEEEQQVLRQLTSAKELTTDLTKELGLEHDMENLGASPSNRIKTD